MNRFPVRLSEIGREVCFYGKPYIWVDGGAGLCLVRRPGWCDMNSVPVEANAAYNVDIALTFPVQLPWGC